MTNQTAAAVADEAALAPVLDDLAERGWSVRPGFLPPSVVAGLRAECLRRRDAGAFHAAGVGPGAARVISTVRGDSIHWLDLDDPEPNVRACLAAAEALRQAANRHFFLGLDEFEAHFAAYPPGSGYRKHLDRFRDDDRRTLTAILYLNDAWTAADGGLLRFWPDPSGEGAYLDIVPAGGTLVTFLSARYWHEVLPARRTRLALTGWFKRRSLAT